MLRLLAPYVSKPAILQALAFAGGLKSKVPIEFQGLGVASQRRFPREFGKLKSASVADENPNVSGVAGRYATALFELAREERTVDLVKADLDRFDAMMAGSADLQRLVRSPVFSSEDQVRALTAILDKAGMTGTSAKFLKVLAANRRLFVVRDVIRVFRTLVAHFKGEAVAEVTVAETLSDKNLDALKGALKAVTGKDVDLKVRVDPEIIGGLIVKVGSRMIDTSLRTKLNSIKHAMKEAG